MSRTIKDATVKRHHHGSHDELRRRPWPFVDVHDHGRLLETLRGLTSHEFICETWAGRPSRLTSDPTRLTLGPKT